MAARKRCFDAVDELMLEVDRVRVKVRKQE